MFFSFLTDVYLIYYLKSKMSSIVDLKKYLLKKSFQTNEELTAFYNYLSHFCRSEQKVTPLLFQQFYRKALLFPYWQVRMNSLQQALKEEWIHFTDQMGQPENSSEEVLYPEQPQIINVQKIKDLEQIVELAFRKEMSTGDQLKVISHREKVVAVLLKFDGQLRVSLFGKTVIIHRGLIEPIAPLSQLHYLASFKLQPLFLQVLESVDSGFIGFQVRNNGQWCGVVSHGPCFHQVEKFSVKQVEQKELLFSGLKQLESLYIQPESDPHYKKLIQLLHTGYRQILTDPDYSVLKTQNILSQAKNAIKNLYPNNRLLLLLTANIEYYLQNRKSPTQSPIESSVKML